MCVLTRSVMSDSATPWTVVRQDPLSVEFSWQEYWSGLPFPLPGDLPDPGIELTSPALAVYSLPLNHLGIPFKSCLRLILFPAQACSV